MSFELAFLDEASKEWRNRDNSTRQQLNKQLAEQSENPRVPSAKFSGHNDRYKIKLRSVGYSLFYKVRDHQLIIVVIAVGKRDRSEGYKAAAKQQTA